MPSKKKPAPSLVIEPEELSAIIPDLLLLEGWCQAMRQLISAQVQAGVVIPGATLEPTKPQRKWEPEDGDLRAILLKTLKALKKPASLDVVAPRSTLSPAQMEKVIGKPDFAEHLAKLAPAKPSGNFSLNIVPPPRG